MSFVDTMKSFLLPAFRWQIDAKTIAGSVRADNEDRVCFFQDERGSMAVLADGVGGHNAGEVAAEFVCDALQTWFKSRPPVREPRDALAQLRTVIETIHADVYRLSIERPEYADMATTLAVALQHKRHAIIGWAGDSRIYLNRAGCLQQLSSDHSFIEEQIGKGLLTRAEAAQHPMASVITSSIGGKPRLARLDLKVLKLEQGDKLLIVSDGVSGVLPPERMLALLPDGVDALLDAAQEAQSADNCSVIIISV
jgi:PPM family protein phosphatase